MNRLLKKIFSIFLSFAIVISCSISNTISYAYSKSTIDKCIKETASLMYNSIPEPIVASIGGEWTVLSLARSGVSVPKEYYDKYYSKVVQKLKSCNGLLHRIKYTEYSRVILALTAINKDVTNVGGYNLLSYLADFNSVKKQGINGPIFALIAYDCNNYEIPKRSDVDVQTTRQVLVDYILSKEINKGKSNAGGWSLEGISPDPDITFMALQALSNYTDQKEVREAVDRALDVMSEMQLSTGGYGSWGTENCESIAQGVVALTALGIDIDSDSRFIKTNSKGKKNTLIDGMLHFYCENGGFAHVTEGYDGGGGSGVGLNAMATDQGMYALIAYNRYLKGQNKLYDMTDAARTLAIGDNEDLEKDDNNKDDNNKDDNNDVDDDNNKDDNNDVDDDNDSNDDNTGSNDDNSNNSNKNNNQNQGKNTNSKNNTNKNTNKNTSKKSSSKKTTKKDKEATISIKSVYTGEKDGLLPEDKKCVIVEFKEKDKKEIVKFKNGDELNDMYYSEELSKISKKPTYVGLFDKNIENKALLNKDNYEFKAIEEKQEEIENNDTALDTKLAEDTSSQEALTSSDASIEEVDSAKYDIIFGDVNSDKIVNAQDILDIQSILSGKLDLVDEKQIIAINVSMDSKIDNSDIDQLKTYFISKSPYTIFKVWDEKALEELAKKAESDATKPDEADDTQEAEEETAD